MMQGTGDVVGKLMAENDALRGELASACEAEAELRRYAQYVAELARQVRGWSEKCSEQRTELERMRALLDLPTNLRYVQARGDDHADLSDALGADRGELDWSQLLQLVRELRAMRDRARNAPHVNWSDDVLPTEIAHYILGEKS